MCRIFAWKPAFHFAGEKERAEQLNARVPMLANKYLNLFTLQCLEVLVGMRSGEVGGGGSLCHNCFFFIFESARRRRRLKLNPMLPQLHQALYSGIKISVNNYMSGLPALTTA